MKCLSYIFVTNKIFTKQIATSCLYFVLTVKGEYFMPQKRILIHLLLIYINKHKIDFSWIIMLNIFLVLNPLTLCIYLMDIPSPCTLSSLKKMIWTKDENKLWDY